MNSNDIGNKTDQLANMVKTITEIDLLDLKRQINSDLLHRYKLPLYQSNSCTSHVGDVKCLNLNYYFLIF